MDESKKPKMPAGRDWRAVCCDLMVIAGGGCLAAGGFLLHVVAGCFVLGGVLIGLAFLLQRQEVDRDAV